jgi:hypothetical protein
VWSAGALLRLISGSALLRSSRTQNAPTTPPLASGTGQGNSPAGAGGADCLPSVSDDIFINHIQKECFSLLGRGFSHFEGEPRKKSEIQDCVQNCSIHFTVFSKQSVRKRKGRSSPV